MQSAKPKRKVIVAIDKNMKDQANMTIVGDWFSAESVSMTATRQTNFTTHAPSINSRIELFDREVKDLLKRNGVSKKDSLKAAIKALKKERRKLKE